MGKFTRNVRLRGTNLEGYVYERFESLGETFYRVSWDHAYAPDSRLYTADELESAERHQMGEGRKYEMSVDNDRSVREFSKIEVIRS